MSSRNNSQQVGQRVQQTKKEIEQLKEELQKLIHRGGQTCSNDVNDDKPAEVQASFTASPQFTSRLHSAKPSNRNITVRSNQSILRSDTKRDVQESPKKVRHYNVEEAREYIRKQKEKRLEQLKTQLKESRNIVDDRKVKLKELERKSRELVHKNVIQKRERSKSRDNAKTEQERQRFDDERKENVPNSNIVLNLKPRDLLNSKQTVPDLIVTNLKVNKPRESVNQVVVEQPVKCPLTEDAAASKIQQYFRKYRKKKLDKQMYEESLRTQKILESKLKETIEYNRRKKSEAEKPIVENVPLKATNAYSEPNLITQKFEVPIWLQPKVEPYPYNFINTVKRKLNFAVSPTKKEAVLDDSRTNVKKLKDDIKKCIENSAQKEVKFENENLGRFLSKRCLDLDFKNVENLHLLQETLPNDCDIKSALKSKCSEETSESDTSKYIPDISTETTASKFSSLSGTSSAKPNAKLNTDKIKDLKLESKPLKTTYFNKKIDKFTSKSSENITKRHSNSPGKSKSLSNVTDFKTDRPSPLEVPKLNLIERESVTERSNGDLKSFLDYMSSLESKRTADKFVENHSDSFVSLPQTSPKTDTVVPSEKASRSRSDNYSSNFSGSTSSASSVPSVKHPSFKITTSEKIEKDGDLDLDHKKTPISIKPGEVKCIETKTNTNQIHLKFEAELHLLNDFNESLRQFMAVEKTILDLHSKSQTNTTILQNQDTQTSAHFEEEEDSITNDNKDKLESTRTNISVTDRKAIVPTINYSRGSDLDETFDQLMQENVSVNNNNNSVQTERREEKSLVSTSLNLSQLDDSVNSTVDESVSNVSVAMNESYTKNMFAGFSVGMFDQLIKDEDTRIENLKTILKIREKALLDRTKGELAWLEIQKKQLIETGQLHEASLLKKKQRGIIIKLQHEKQEMQRLKQVQKQASKERKTVLKEQRNMIKAQLSNNYTIPKIKRSTHRDRRQSGPVKVYNVHRETINTETSISRRNSVAEEIIITSRSESVVDHITEDFSVDQDSVVLNTSIKSVLNKRTEDAKKSLLMREAALARRKKAAEDLLRWHQRLLEEERKIAELEMAANTIIKQAPSMVSSGQDNLTKQKHNFKGSQLNLLWTNMTGRSEKKFKEDENYSLSQASLEKFCKEAKRIAGRNEKKHSSDTSISTDESRKSTRSNNSVKTDENVKSNSYSTDFEIPEDEIVRSEIISTPEITSKPVLENEIDKSKSTLNEIMQNISNITDEISAIYKLSTVANSSNETTKDSRTIQIQNQDTNKSKSEIDNQISSEVEKTIENDKTKTSAGIKTSDSSKKTIETLKTSEPIETNECSESKIETRSSDLQTDIKRQLNDILSEGTKRINSILSTRKSSAISSETGENTTSSDNKSLETKPIKKTIENLVESVSSRKPIESDFSQDTINILSQSLKTDIDPLVDDIMSGGSKKILSSQSQIDIFPEKKLKSDDQINISSDRLLTENISDGVASQKISSDFKTDIDHQIDEILSEGTKRISDILSSRSQRSPIVTENETMKKSLSNGTNISKASVKSDIIESISDYQTNNEDSTGKTKSAEKIDDQMNAILSDSSKKISDILSSRSQKSSIVTENETMKKTVSNGTNISKAPKSDIIESISDHLTNNEDSTGKTKFAEKIDVSDQMNVILSDSSKKMSDILSSRSQISSAIITESDTMKNKTLDSLSEDNLHTNDPKTTESFIGNIKFMETIDDEVKEILSDSNRRISNILSYRTQKSSASIAESDTMKNNTKSRSQTNISNDSIKSDVKEIYSDRLDKTNDILSDGFSGKTKGTETNDDQMKEILSESSKRISDILTIPNRKSSAIVIESDTLKNKSYSDDSNILNDSIKSDVKEVISDHLDKTNDILSEGFSGKSKDTATIDIDDQTEEILSERSKRISDIIESDTLKNKSDDSNILNDSIKSDIKVSMSDQLDKTNEILSDDTLKTSNHTQNDKQTENLTESTKPTVLKSNDPTDTIRTKNESLNTSVQLIKTLTESVKTNDEIETPENSFPPPSKNTAPDSSATLSSKVELPSTPNEHQVEINYAGHTQNNEIANADILNQKSFSIHTEKENKAPEIKSTLSDMSSMKDEDAENSNLSRSGAFIFNKSLEVLEKSSTFEDAETESKINETKASKCSNEDKVSNSSSNLDKSGVLIFTPLKASEKASIVSLLEEVVENGSKSQMIEISSILKTNDSAKELKISKRGNDEMLNKAEVKLPEKASTLSEMSSIKDDDDKTSISNVTKSGVLIFKPLKTSEKTSIVSKLEEISRAETESKIETMNEINSQITSSNTLKDLKINGHTPDSKLTNSHHKESFELIIDPIEKDIIEDLNKSAKNEADDDTTASSISTSDELSHSSDLKLDNDVSNYNTIYGKVIDTVASIDKESVSELLKSDDSKTNDIKSEASKSSSGKDSPDFVDVKKRVSEILADAHSPRGDKSPRLQDIYTTTYDILSPDRSPEMGSPVNSDKDLVVVNQLFGEEAEALLRKQLAIEQEIKQLEQQQKEQIPYLYMREIPNKPPPPYTPPQPLTNSIVPASVDQLDTIVCSLSRILHISYFKGTLETSTLTERDKRTFTTRNNVEKECYEFVFDLCKELAVEHYKQFRDEPRPSWMKISKKSLAPRKPFNELELREYLFAETKVLLGFEKVAFKENIVTKWSRKKRDHVDEILVMESQEEESEWTNYDEDEVIVKDELTNDIMNMLLNETANVFQEILRKKGSGQRPS